MLMSNANQTMVLPRKTAIERIPEALQFLIQWQNRGFWQRLAENLPVECATLLQKWDLKVRNREQGLDMSNRICQDRHASVDGFAAVDVPDPSIERPISSFTPGDAS